MPDQITITPKTQPASTNSPGIHTTGSARTQLANLCALGLGASFFLPWARVFFGSPSGFDLQKLGDEQLLLWLIPVFCAITILAGLAKRGQHIAGQLTGVLPFIVGIYWYSKIGNDLFHILTYGAFLSLAFGAALFVLSRKSK